MTISFNDMNAIASHKSSIVQTGRYTELQNVVFGLNTVFLVLAMIAIGLRVWSRRLKRMRLMMNDIVASVSLVRLSLMDIPNLYLNPCPSVRLYCLPILH